MSSEIDEHVTITTAENAGGITRAGFGTQGIMSCNATFPERSRTYSDLPGMVDDGMGSKSPEYRAAQKAFGQKPRPKTVKILRASGKPTLKYRIDVSLVGSGNKYGVNIKGSLATIADTAVVYTPGADLVFTAANGTELFTSALHGMATGDGPYRVSNSGGALPAGLAVDTDYWIIADVANGVVDPVNTFQMATSKANALAGTELLITTDGTGTQTLRRAQNDVIIAQLKQGVNAIANKNFTAVQTTGAGETDYLEITGDAAGVWFAAEVTSVKLLKIECTHAVPGTTLTTDLDAINEEDPDWYGLTILYPSDGCIKDAAAWAEGNGKIFVPSMSDSTIVTSVVSAGDGDTANDLKNLAYARTAVIYHPNPAAFAGAAWQGRVLPTEPGKATWKFKTLTGVENTVLTATHRVNLRAKNTNAYQKVGGRNITWEGKTADGDFIDATRNIDWLDDDMQKGVFGALANNDIVPMTEEGKAIVLNEIEASLSRAVKRGILVGGDEAPVVTAPLIIDVSDVDRGARNLPDINWSGRLAGAIHKGDINGNVRV